MVVVITVYILFEIYQFDCSFVFLVSFLFHKCQLIPNHSPFHGYKLLKTERGIFSK